MPTCTLTVLDQVNVKFSELDPFTRKKMTDALKFLIPHARHTPAFKLGRWDGKMSFVTSGGGTFLNLIDRVLPIVMEAGYEVEVVDKRPPLDVEWPEVDEGFVSDRRWPKGHPMAGKPIMLRDYQVTAIQTYIANLQSIQSISTGAGKTLLTASLSLLVEMAMDGRTIVIVPNKSLVEQTEEDYRNLSLDVGVFYGERKEWGHKHTICTWQSLAIFAKKSKSHVVETPIEDFIDGVVCVMVDETHSVKGTELKDLMCGALAGIPIRWGLTGTIPKEDFEFMALLSSIGPVVGEIRAADLQERGVLAKVDIELIELKDDHHEFDEYQDEYNYLTGDQERLEWVAEYITKLAESGNTLVLVNRIDTGERLTDMIPGAVFISGQMKTTERSREYRKIQTSNNRIIIATFGVAAVGINVPRIFNLAMLEVGKSFVRTIQAAGRILRKANDKDSANIKDITSNLKFSKRHAAKRKEYYGDADYPFRTTKIDYRRK